MAKNKFKMNYAGIGQLLKSAEMQNILEEKATSIRNRAGEGYKQDIYVGKNRANAMIYADSYQSKRDNLKNNTLLKAVR